MECILCTQLIPWGAILYQNLLYNTNIPIIMNDLTVQELKERMEKGEKLNIIDVREPYEFEEFNIGAELIPLGSIPTKLDELAHLKNKEIIVHCRSGARSGNAKLFLMDNGFTNVRNLLGGMLAWRDAFGE
jgi:rhodanese-related sulfurtransferase